MDKKYNTIEFGIGNNIEDAVLELVTYTVEHKGELACGEFNTHTLYSDTVSLDGAYKEITGKTYTEFQDDQKKWHEDYERKEKEFKETIPALTCEWRNKGHEVLSHDHWVYWDKIVPIRLNDLYHGMELGCCLDIVKILNDGGTLDEAKAKIDSQGHSGMSYSLVRAMVKEFAERGNEFADYVKL